MITEPICETLSRYDESPNSRKPLFGSDVADLLGTSILDLVRRFQAVKTQSPNQYYVSNTNHVTANVGFNEENGDINLITYCGNVNRTDVIEKAKRLARVNHCIIYAFFDGNKCCLKMAKCFTNNPKVRVYGGTFKKPVLTNVFEGLSLWS